MSGGAGMRCAIYARKSGDEAADSQFGSISAQTEMCRRYIESQAEAGWSALDTVYADEGFSGGSLKRPALQQLLADTKVGRIDVVVVYKIDRLSRSLKDFLDLVTAFDAAGITFVSITQAFNTTTSVGRLTLNILLSFGQFERELIGERLRDWFAGARRRGPWVAGTRPYGYWVKAQRLVPHPRLGR